MRIEALDCFEEQMLDQDIAACYRQGLNGNVVKPVVFNEFVKTISALAQY